MSSATSHCSDGDDDISDDKDERKESRFRGSIKKDTYKAYFKAANSKIYVLIVFLVFIAAQVIGSGTDYFLSEWYVTYNVFIISKFFEKKIQLNLSNFHIHVQG